MFGNTLVQPRNARRFERFGTLYVELYEDPNGGALFFGIVNFDWIFEFGFGIDRDIRPYVCRIGETLFGTKEVRTDDDPSDIDGL